MIDLSPAPGHWHVRVFVCMCAQPNAIDHRILFPSISFLDISKFFLLLAQFREAGLLLIYFIILENRACCLSASACARVNVYI